ncbi:MAG: hypothetical protein J7L34_00735 [Thermotogaceae bacterium]|nr:hypothetical protein [Thermotogaceae bacterium]
MGEVVNVGQEFLNRFKIPKTCWEGKISYEQAQMFEKEKVAELEYVQSVLPRLPGAQLEVLLMSPAATEPIRAFIPRTDFAPWDWWLNQIRECPEKYFWHFFYSPVVIAADGQRYSNALVIDVDDIKLEPVEYFWKLIPAESEKVDFDILKIEYFTKGKPLPSFMVWTGGGAHLYFLLDRVYPVGENLSKIKTIYRFLSRVYNGDTGAGFFFKGI